MCNKISLFVLRRSFSCTHPSSVYNFLCDVPFLNPVIICELPLVVHFPVNQIPVFYNIISYQDKDLLIFDPKSIICNCKKWVTFISVLQCRSHATGRFGRKSCLGKVDFIFLLVKSKVEVALQF